MRIILLAFTILTGLTAGLIPASAQTPVPLKLDYVVEFQTRKGPVRFCTHFAQDAVSRQIGLMWQTNLPDDAAMLFNFHRSDTVYMWMKNTVLPLDMIFITKDLQVHRIEKQTTPYSTAIISSEGPVHYVLEVNGGQSDKVGISKGDPVKIISEKCEQ